MTLTTEQVDKAALILLDFQVDVCDSGGKMVSQDAAVLNDFKQARTQAAKVLNATRAATAGPKIVHVMHAFQAGYPEMAGGRLCGMDSYVQQVGAFVEGEAGTQIVSELQPQNDEYLIKKHTLSPFASTELGWWLNKRGINTVILAGVVTHYAVLATAISAFDAGYEVIVLTDCCMSGTPETHSIALEILGPICELTTSDALLAQYP